MPFETGLLTIVGTLEPPVSCAIAQHVVGGSILFPGVGYVEMAFASSSDASNAIADMHFLQPCTLPGPSAKEADD